MSRACLWTIILMSFWLLSCDVHFSGYPVGEPEEDWSDFDLVFSADPIYQGDEPMLVKLNFAEQNPMDFTLEGQPVSGEVATLFWSEFTGRIVGEEVALEMMWENGLCIGDGPSHAIFNGILTPDRLVGRFVVSSCNDYEFDYDGKLVGGRDF